MKLVAIGDIHGRNIWKQIIAKEHDADEFVFVGDYFDSFTVKGPDQINNFLDIIEFKKQSKVPVTLIIGNHDYHYYPGIDETGTSGYQTVLAPSIKHVVGDNKQHLQAAYQSGEFVFTHAGLSSEWLDDIIEDWNVDNVVDKVNELFQYQPGLIAYRSFKMVNETEWYGAQGYGNESFQSPIWIRPSALMTANKKTLRKKIIQVVGHTPQDNIDIKGKATGGRYYFIDTLEYNQGQYLIVTDGVVSLGKLDNEKTQTK
jgi:DNA repair exonuclease SbcCD nuclease subunit